MQQIGVGLGAFCRFGVDGWTFKSVSVSATATAASASIVVLLGGTSWALLSGRRDALEDEDEGLLACRRLEERRLI
jgi:hypothetical protein